MIIILEHFGSFSQKKKRKEKKNILVRFKFTNLIFQSLLVIVRFKNIK